MFLGDLSGQQDNTEDISVIGFGGYEASEILTPKLSTVRYDSDTAGYLAGETMIKMIIIFL